MTATYQLAHSAPARRKVIAPVARLGLTARAFIYLLIGVLAFLVSIGHSTAETDQWGAMQQLNRGAAGHVALWVVAAGLAGYALWRLSEAVFGASGEGRKAGPRLKSFFRACVYAFIAATALEIVLGRGSKSQAGRQQNLSDKVMHHTGGRIAVGLVGAVVVVVGLTLVLEGVRRKFEKYLDLASLTRASARAITYLGVVGTTVRGAVFALAGGLVIQAAWDYQPKKAAGLDGALRALRDTPAGPWVLGAAAAGLVAFGLYGFAEARWRRT
jgi:hypothetical protein